MKRTETAQDAAVRALIDGEHFRYRPFGEGKAGEGEIRVGADWSLDVDAAATSLTEVMLADFRTFCRECLDLDFTSSSPAPSASVIRWTCPGTGAPADPQDPSVESFSIRVEEGGMTIEAGHERGLLHGTHYLERMMADRGGPIVPVGRIKRTPVFSPRITNSIFIEPHQNITDPDQFSDEYLGLMSHFGGNGIHLLTKLADVCRSEILPELNTPDFDLQVEGLNRLCDRTQARGIDVYPCLITAMLEEDHPVFQAHPEVRGALGSLMQQDMNNFCLCSSHEKVLSFYEEAIRNLLHAVPRLAGIICIVGGEGFFHCYTRPKRPFTGRSSCVRCRDLDPSASVASLVNRIAGSVKATGRHKSAYVWPYSAFTWSGSNDRAQLPWIDQLFEDVSVVANYATGSPDPVNQAGVYLYDYNIKTVGSSEIFAQQHARVTARGKKMYAKMESCTTPTFFCIPYIPLHQRWHARAKAMAAQPVAGFIGQWRFFGMNGSPPEEMQYHATWNPGEEADDLLTRMARRDFGITGDEAAKAVRGWACLSRAWDDLPYGAMLSGERQFYMRGPMYLGPSHPLIFNPQSAYGLSRRFWTLRADAEEWFMPEEVAEMEKTMPPRYIDQLLLALPYGEERFLELISRCRTQWEEGVALLGEALSASASPRARMELDVCQAALIHLTTVDHVARFYRERDRLWREPIDRDTFVGRIDTLTEIAQAEIQNARRALPLLERDPRIGYNYCYRVAYDAEMVKEKIAQCEIVVNDELPGFNGEIRFHVWMEFP